MMLSGASGIPGWGHALGAIGPYMTGEQMRHHSLARQGIEGYSSGTIGGNPFTISPGLFGRGITGNVPQGFTVTMAENMQAVAAGIDPNTGLPLVSGTGQGGYNEAGDWVDAYGNVSAYGLMQDAQALADKHGISLGNVRAALAKARSGGGLGMSIQALKNSREQQERIALEDWVGPKNGDAPVPEIRRQPEAIIAQRERTDQIPHMLSPEDKAKRDEAWDRAAQLIEQTATLDWDEGGGDDPDDADMGGFDMSGEADEWGGDYGVEFNTGGPVIKRRGSGETATSPLAAGNFVDKPLYDRAVDTSPTYRRW